MPTLVLSSRAIPLSFISAAGLPIDAYTFAHSIVGLGDTARVDPSQEIEILLSRSSGAALPRSAGGPQANGGGNDQDTNEAALYGIEGERVRVISNIYENPELLKDQNS
jgi:hypothetical protein